MAVRQHARLLHESDVNGIDEGGCVTQWLVSPDIGAQHVMSYRSQVGPGRSTAHQHSGCDEVLYVLEGNGRVWIDGRAVEVVPGTALLVPDGTEHGFENHGPQPMLVVGAMAPPIDPATVRPSIPHLGIPNPGANSMVHESTVAPTMMGERSFKVLLSSDLGCRQMTQFTGVIPPGRAPLHAHPHEEAVYILAGRGRLWVESDSAGELRPGSVVFIPIGVRHTLENTGDREILKVLGAFSPAGSPEAKLPPTH